MTNYLISGAKVGAIAFILAVIIFVSVVRLFGNKQVWASFIDASETGTFVLGSAFAVVGILSILTGLIIQLLK
ncbi:hypothetical protein [Spirosoma sp. 48-14]|uniref:hypothetical protein n=1 Tax=Spirosoma sp. 48-14 TaxID=1895854 RepID=UPI00095F0E44|nr:hypothetical protein [Spirosoma sp. 48-14]OJW78416.1 MAG: hypothetical protein BGO59_30920 [Spirosoma sp. 48-14]